MLHALVADKGRGRSKPLSSFSNSSRLVVAEYPDRIMEWNGEERRDSCYFHLLEKNKKAYGNKKTYDKQYVHAPDSETYLVEFLKWLQKNV